MNTENSQGSYPIHRQLTSYKIAFARERINSMNVQPGEKYIVEIYNKGGRDDHDILGTWHVHYIRVLNDGEKIFEQDEINGSYQTVNAQFNGLLR